MSNLRLPWWAYALMGAGLLTFIVLVALSVKRNHGMKRSLFSTPYTLWMLLFTILPCVLIGYYALVNSEGTLTLDNFRSFWDSNWNMKSCWGRRSPPPFPGAPSM